MRDSDEFAAARRSGARSGSRVLVVHLSEPDRAADGVPDPDVGSAHAGVVVGRSVGPAVVRNRVKRRLRHLIADRWDSLPMGSRLVVRALPPSAGRTHAQLGSDLDRLLARAREQGAAGARR